MLLVVALISFLVHLYSVEYMKGDPRYSRYFAFLGVFTFSMNGIVLADSLVMMYIFWELVGLSSYLLIGFWFEKESAANASKKAFLTNRVGDIGMFIGIMILFFEIGSFQISGLIEGVQNGAFSEDMTLLTIAGVLVFMGAIGKSAQFPLHIWLPDAMEGPTPVSALIHAATMVAAGVYMVVRIFPILTPDALEVIAYVGGITALMAAIIAITQNDIKRVLAYSTVSQLGYMIMALGVGAYQAGFFHLTTHAMFKACLFLCSGSVIHAMHHALHELPNRCIRKDML
jgi:NADH-quinone oxidoreductase subunit L